MKAYQVTQFGAPIEPHELPDPNPVGREVLIDVVSCGLCHSDAHFHQGHLGVGGGASIPVSTLGIELPATFGHEICGTIAAFGPDAGLTARDLRRPVIVYPWIGCGHCAACLATARPAWQNATTSVLLRVPLAYNCQAAMVRRSLYGRPNISSMQTGLARMLPAFMRVPGSPRTLRSLSCSGAMAG